MLVVSAGYLGDVNPGATIHFLFTAADAAGAPATLAGSPSVFLKQNNSTTTLASGVALTVDFDGITGLNLVTCNLSDPVFDGSNSFNAYIHSGNVDGTNVAGYVVASFSTLNRTVGSATAANQSTILSQAAAIKAKTDQLSFTGSRVDAGLADSDGVTELKFRALIMAFALNESVVTTISGDTKQVEYKNRDGTTTVATVTFDFAEGSRSDTSLA